MLAEATAVADFLEDIPVAVAGWAEVVEDGDRAPGEVQALPTAQVAAVDYSADEV